MNEGAAKAERRAARARGEERNAAGKLSPRRETKSLWDSLNHEQRGQWRSKFRPTRARLRRGRFSDVIRSYNPSHVSWTLNGVKYVTRYTSLAQVQP